MYFTDFSIKTSFSLEYRDGFERLLGSDIGGTWVEYGVGGNFRLCKNAYGYVDLERTSGAEVNANYRWNIGLRTFF